jgi:hypothetical protein
MLLLGILGDATRELTWKVWISCLQNLLKSSLLDHCILSTLPICEHLMDQKLNVKFYVKLQKSPTGQMPVCGVAIKEFPQAKKATGVKIQMKTMLLMFFCNIRGMINYC